MNKIYKVIWSKVRSAWVVVSEITRNHGAKSRSVHIGTKLTGASLAFAILLSIGLGGTAWADTTTTTIKKQNDPNKFNLLYFSWDHDNHAIGLGSSTDLMNLPAYSLSIGDVNIRDMGTYATAIGYNASAAAHAMAIGYNSSAVAGTIALGEGSKTSTSNAADQQGYMPWEGSSLGNVQNSTFKAALSGAAWKSTGVPSPSAM